MTKLTSIKIPKRNGTPTNPETGFVKIYVKIADGKVYILNDAGVETEVGRAGIETSQATIESPINSESDKFVSARRFWQGIISFLSYSWTWVAKQTFLVAPRLTGFATKYIKTNADGDIVGLDQIPVADINGLVIPNITASNGLTKTGNDIKFGGELDDSELTEIKRIYTDGQSGYQIYNDSDAQKNACTHGFYVTRENMLKSALFITGLEYNTTTNKYVPYVYGFIRKNFNYSEFRLNEDGSFTVKVRTSNSDTAYTNFTISPSGITVDKDITTPSARDFIQRQYVDAIQTTIAALQVLVTDLGTQYTSLAGYVDSIVNDTLNPLIDALNNLAIGNIFGLNDALDLKADLVGGVVPSSQLPPTVDEILEYANLAAFPATGETNKYYLALDSNKTYRWSGSVYTPINEGIALGETSSTAYRGDRGKTAYDHSQATGNPHGTTIAQISGLQGAIDAKVDLSGDTLTGLLKFATALWDSADTSIPNYEILKDYVSSKISVTILASMPASLPFTGQTRIGSKTSPLSDLTIPAPAASPIEGAMCIIYMKRDDAQIPFFNSTEYEDFSCPFIQGVVNEIIVRYSGGKYSCSSSQKLANPSASSLLITSLFNFGAYANYLEGDTLTANASATISPTWTWLSATDAAGAGEATLATGQTRVVAGTEAFITFKVVGRSGMFNGDEVKLTPFNPVKSISEDSNWDTNFWFDNNRFTRSTGNSNAPTKITGAGVGFSGNHVSIVSSTTGASKLFIAIGGTVANQPQIPVSAQFYLFEVEIWCNADKDLRFRMDDNELFQEWYQDGNYGAAVTPTVFRAFNTVVTKRIIVRNNQNTSNSRFAVETTGTGTIGDEIRVNIKRAGLISA